MEAHPRQTSSVYSSFELESLLEHIIQEQGFSREYNGRAESSEADSSRKDCVFGERDTLTESCELTQTLEQQLVMQNRELRVRRDRARDRFACVYNAMKSAMEVSRQLHAIYLRVAHEKGIEKKKEIASREEF